jgi:hypothetical protein
MEVTRRDDNGRGRPHAGMGIAARETEKQRTKNSRRQTAEHTGAMAAAADARAVLVADTAAAHCCCEFAGAATRIPAFV